MTDQVKISASLQDAQAYIAECLEFVTQDEPFVLDFNDSYESYVQAVRDDFDQICVEIAALNPSRVSWTPRWPPS